MGDGEHKEGQGIEPVKPVSLRPPGGKPTGQQTDQRRQSATAHHHITAGGIGHIPPDGGADGTGQAGCQHKAAQQEWQRGLGLGHQHQKRRGQRRRHQQGPGDHETSERGIVFQQAETGNGFLEGVISPFAGPGKFVHGEEHHGSDQPGHPCRCQQCTVKGHGGIGIPPENHQRQGKGNGP